MKNEEADNEGEPWSPFTETTIETTDDQTFWYVCEYCDEGFYSLVRGIERMEALCDRCWKEVHG